MSSAEKKLLGIYDEEINVGDTIVTLVDKEYLMVKGKVTDIVFKRRKRGEFDTPGPDFEHITMHFEYMHPYKHVLTKAYKTSIRINDSHHKIAKV